jgi:hypothetical protein
MSTRWDYKTVRIDPAGFFGGNLETEGLDKTLNAMGQDGWELSSTIETNWGHGATRYVYLLFKRPAPGHEQAGPYR